MYQINPTTNEIVQLTPKSFTDLGFKEREHLQEWIAKMPESLGEELLIIQKEFDGFDETRERLDLLALDKQGDLVIIENKLDDSGKDVVWQALKYASYCSSLSKSQIVDIYTAYLERYEGGGIRLQCFKATPYKQGEQLFLTLDQIIPTPEEAEFRVGIAAKDKEQKTAVKSQTRSLQLRPRFWTKALEALEIAGVSQYQNISPSKDHWLSSAAGIRGGSFNLIFAQKEIRIDFYLSHPAKEENKEIFDLMYAKKAIIEESFGKELIWQRLDDKKACRVKYSKDIDGFDEENWDDMIEWLIKHYQLMEKAMRPHIDKIKKNR